MQSVSRQSIGSGGRWMFGCLCLIHGDSSGLYLPTLYMFSVISTCLSSKPKLSDINRDSELSFESLKYQANSELQQSRNNCSAFISHQMSFIANQSLVNTYLRVVIKQNIAFIFVVLTFWLKWLQLKWAKLDIQIISLISTSLQFFFDCDGVLTWIGFTGSDKFFGDKFPSWKTHKV